MLILLLAKLPKSPENLLNDYPRYIYKFRSISLFKKLTALINPFKFSRKKTSFYHFKYWLFNSSTQKVTKSRKILSLAIYATDQTFFYTRLFINIVVLRVAVIHWLERANCDACVDWRDACMPRLQSLVANQDENKPKKKVELTLLRNLADNKTGLRKLSQKHC